MSSVPRVANNKPELTDEERERILQLLLQRFDNARGKLQQGAIGDTAISVKLSRRTVSRIWNRARETFAKDSIYKAPSRKSVRCGRKPKDFSEVLHKIESVPLSRRSTIRSLAQAIEVPKTTLHRKFKAGFFKRISSAIKPLLTDENKRHRVRFCRSFIRPDGYFDPMFTRVHIDEKWFYITQCKRAYYITNEEEAPERQCQSKRFIGKIMFMAAVARPQPGFDGKLGIWPFVEYGVAKRASKNRPKGAPIIKPMAVIDRNEVKKMIIENVLPAIREKFPIESKPHAIVIQQDNAKPHLLCSDPDLLEAAAVDGWSIKLANQPANSPDLNVLDLGFFNSIQALQQRASVHSLDDLIREVDAAFHALQPEILQGNLTRSNGLLKPDMFYVVGLHSQTSRPLPKSAERFCGINGDFLKFLESNFFFFILSSNIAHSLPFE